MTLIRDPEKRKAARHFDGKKFAAACRLCGVTYDIVAEETGYSIESISSMAQGKFTVSPDAWQFVKKLFKRQLKKATKTAEIKETDFPQSYNAFLHCAALRELTLLNKNGG